MSLKIIKAGILDSIQDRGRFGYRHQGINPTGVMDSFAASLANVLVGNAEDEAVIELHFPASSILFEHPAIIALTGSDFSATINGQNISSHATIAIPQNALLQFTAPIAGARCYLAIHGGYAIPKWLNSASTHFKAAAGGFNGRKLMRDDCLNFNKLIRFTSNQPVEICSTNTHLSPKFSSDQTIKVIKGNEWSWMTSEAQELFISQPFSITLQSDRMGYRLDGPTLEKKTEMGELVSTPVTFGTIQLLPDGHPIVLMADHQTTGGYPRIAHVISACLPAMAQKTPGDSCRFQFVDIRTAEQLWLEQKEKIAMVKRECKAKLIKFIEDHH